MIVLMKTDTCLRLFSRSFGTGAVAVRIRHSRHTPGIAKFDRNKTSGLAALGSDRQTRRRPLQATEPAHGSVLRPLAGIAMVRHRVLDEYERLLAPARERFAASPGVQAIQSA